MAGYRALRVWQQGMELAVRVYRATESFPKHELYGLAGQLRRAAVSIPSNIAEGKGRHTDRDYSAFLFRARGSLLEVETQIMIAKELNYLSDESVATLLRSCAAIGSSLAGLINALRPAAGASN